MTWRTFSLRRWTVRPKLTPKRMERMHENIMRAVREAPRLIRTTTFDTEMRDFLATRKKQEMPS